MLDKENKTAHLAFVKEIIKLFETHLDDTNLKVERDDLGPGANSILGHLYYAIEHDLVMHLFTDKKRFFEIKDKSGEVLALISNIGIERGITWEKIEEIKKMLKGNQITENAYKVLPLDENNLFGP